MARTTRCGLVLYRLAALLLLEGGRPALLVAWALGYRLPGRRMRSLARLTDTSGSGGEGFAGGLDDSPGAHRRHLATFADT